VFPVRSFARDYSLACHVKKRKANYRSHEVGTVMGSRGSRTYGEDAILDSRRGRTFKAGSALSGGIFNFSNWAVFVFLSGVNLPRF
jgi:hypothetical protein